MFGTEEDLKALSHELHQRGMYLMLDVVPNHMGSHSPRDQVDYSQLNPFNDQSYFHPPCAVDYNNPATLQNCWLGSNRVSLPDLRTEDPTVANMFNRWISEMVANYSIDGLRIDTAQHVDPAFLSGFQAAAGGIHVLGEVWNGNPEELCPHQNTMTGLLNYASYYWITQAFQNSTTNLTTLRNNLEWLQARCRDVTVLGTFIENHDNPRYANTTTDPSRIRNALAFALLADGIPIIYQGQEHLFAGGPVPTNREPLWPTAHDPTTTPLYPFLRALNRARSRAIAHDPAFVTYHAHAVGLGPDDDDRSLLVMRKGHAGAQIVAVFNNLGAAAGARPVTVGGKAGFTPGQVVVDVLTCRAYGVDRRGNVGVEIRAGEPIVLFPQAVLESGTCGQP
jgi:alpha-amylase